MNTSLEQVDQAELLLCESGLASDNVRYQRQISYIMSSSPDGFPTSGIGSENRTGFSVTTSSTAHTVGPNPGTILILDGDLLPTSMSDRFLQRVWARLDASEKYELNPHLRDDLRIAKLCILNVERGQADPWRFAFWTYMGITPEKWQGIQAEREAYSRSMGPTLAEQLQDPTFLASLDAEVRNSLLTARPQMRLGFSPEPVPSPKSKKSRRIA